MSDEHTITILSFAGAIKREAARLRARLKPAAEAGQLGENRLDLTIEIEGRILDGELKITYGLGAYGKEVEGGTLDAVVDEYLRRAGWKAQNAPLEISAGEEIPF